ncbi:hypothetical protein SAMN05421759_1018 [Roseivivax lentus]|uniref:Uncharacterized protein n=2 Tax=Roseivivax lentus TaxID=633194 RepID=A0A1N7JJQ3_9RHOB|nr:hypothetical protein SAMN05421759_1018 [Roseivivax lentus]
MQSTRTELGPVRYNAAEEAFEAVVIFNTEHGEIRRPAHYPAPLTAPEALVRRGLLANAALADAGDNGLKSVLLEAAGPASATRAGPATDLFEKTKDFFAFVRNKAA